MPVLFASNSKIHFSATGLSTSTTYRRTANVDQAFQIFDNSTHGVGPFPDEMQNHTEVWFQFQWYKSSVGSSTDDGYMARVYDDSGRECMRLDVSNGYVWLILYGNSTYQTASFLMGSGLHSYKIRYRNDGPGGVLQGDIYVDNVLRGTTSGTNNTRTMPQNWNFEMLDASSSTDFVSEFVISTTDLSDFGMTVKRSSVLGTDNDFTGDVATVTDDNKASGMLGANVGNRQSFIPTAISTAKLIHSYAPNAMVYCGNTPRTVRFYLKIGGTRYPGANKVLTINKQNFIQDNFLLDPSDNQPWTDAKVNAAEVGIEIVA